MIPFIKQLPTAAADRFNQAMTAMKTYLTPIEESSSFVYYIFGAVMLLLPYLILEIGQITVLVIFIVLFCTNRFIVRANRRRAYQTGFSEGYAAGYRSGYATAEKRHEAELRQLLEEFKQTPR